MVEPLPLRRVEGKRLAFPDPGGEAIDRVAFAEYLFHYGARLPHGGYRPGCQRDRLTVSRHRHKRREIGEVGGVTVRSLPLRLIVINCSPIYN